VSATQKLTIISFLLLSCALSSCQDEAPELLEKYARVECRYQASLNKRDSVSAAIQALEKKATKLTTETQALSAAYDTRIAAIRQQMRAVEDKHLERFNKMSADFEAKRGHMVTPDFERSLAALETAKEKTIAGFDQQVKQLESKREQDPAYAQKMQELEQVKAELAALKEGTVSAEFVKAEKERDNLLNVLGAYEHHLSKGKYKRFVTEKQRIQANPCKD
jgi:hypothetical protein